MITPSDFKRLSEDGTQFESLVSHLLEAMGFRILESPAVGADGGRDILAERVLADALSEKRERVVVQCKHFARSGRAVTERDLGTWVNSLIRYHAHLYLLVTSTYITENLNRVFIEYSKHDELRRSVVVWNVDKLVDLLNQHARVRDTFFPQLDRGKKNQISEFGWGAIFTAECPPEIYDALEPLLSLRKKQAAEKASKSSGCLPESRDTVPANLAKNSCPATV